MKKTPGVAFYGKVRIPTIGHKTAIDAAKDISKRVKGKLTVGLSGTAEPLDLKTKKSLAQKIFNHPVNTGTPETKTLASFLTHLNKSHDELHLVAGSDRVPEYKAFIDRYNGKPDRSGKAPFTFKKVEVHTAGGERTESNKDPRKMSQAELTSSVSASKLESLAKEGNWEHFKAYHPGMSDSHVRRVFTKIRTHHGLNESYTLTEEVTRKELAPMLDSFVSFASDKLGLKSMPTVRYKTDDDDYNSFAAYNPASNELSVSTINRHPMDIFRSVAHELVHHKQNEDGRIGKDVAKEGETGSDIENEANAEAGKIMRWFAKSNPDMFSRSYVVESTNSAALAPVGGIRGLGNVTGEVSPTVTSQYVTTNQQYTNTLKGNQLSGLWVDDGIDSFWLDNKGKTDYHKKTAKSYKTVKSQLNEGINDPGKLKAIFLAGGPGSGKDYVMNATLAGEGLKEINSDVAFEYLMQKNGLDLEMPDEERVERDIVRGRAKNITKEQERLALAGRLGLIINGTADDLEKIKTIKRNLEADGYETMMVFVNTSNEVSRERNVERGKMGKRKVPDGTDKQGNPDNSPNIRQEKWDLAQKNIGELQKIFGNENFAVIDNTADIRKVGPEEKAKVLTSFNRVRRMAQQFVRADNKNPNARKWIEREAEKRGITYQEPKRYKSLTQIRQDVPQVIHKPDNELMLQARRLGLSYYGFGRFGRKVGGINKVLFHSKGGKLIRVQNMNEEKKMKNDPCWKDYEMIGKKKKNVKEVPNCVPVDEGHETVTYTKMHKGSNRPKIKMKRKLAENINNDFSVFMEEHGAGDFGTNKLRRNYEKETPYQPVRKKIVAQEDELPLKMGYGLPMIDSGLGPETSQYRQMAAMGFGAGLPLSESIISWINNEKTQEKFIAKYGKLAEEKLIETALMLEQSGCGTTMTSSKSVKKLKETFPTAPYKDTEGDMSSIGIQNKDRIGNGLAEKKLTEPEMKKREEIVLALKRKGMPKERAYPIATNRAKQVAEQRVDKSAMACNKPRAQAHGSGEKGKSHIVKACAGGKEKVIRFGQLGVKGSPKKKGESEAYRKRREAFYDRHKKNIKKGKMSAAYWANKVKW